MQIVIFIVYYTILLLATIVGLSRYKHLDDALRLIVILLLLTDISEAASYVLIKYKEYGARYSLFHVYSVIQLIFISLFFIFTIKPRNYQKLIVTTIILCPLIGILNIVLFQPINKLNTYMLMFESMAINTMSLYLIYITVRKSVSKNIFRSTHIKITFLFLLHWSCTFFFWAFISVLFIEQWEYVNLASYMFAMVNIVVYGGIGLTLYFHYQENNIYEHD